MMNAIKKLIIGFLLVIGLPISLVMIIQIFDSSITKEERDGAIAALFIIGLPPTAIATYLMVDLKNNQQKILTQTNVDKEQIFLQLLAENNGEITPLKFALKSQLTIDKAKEYLDSKAQELDGDYTVNDEGSIIYKFYI